MFTLFKTHITLEDCSWKTFVYDCNLLFGSSVRISLSPKCHFPLHVRNHVRTRQGALTCINFHFSDILLGFSEISAFPGLMFKSAQG